MDVRYRRTDGKLTRHGEAETSTVTANIGVGGALVLTDRPEAVGTNLEVCIQVPGQPHELILQSEVRWVRPSSPERAGGMGLKFEPLEVAALLLLREYFSTLGPLC